jgi:hypothetical protein
MKFFEKNTVDACVARWKHAAHLLEKVRDGDIRSVNTAQAMKNYTGIATWAVTHRPSPATSGLIEQQRWFMKLMNHS